MASRSIRFLCAGILLICAAALDAGGWVVITVTELPDYIVVGKPVTLTYAVRQHGKNLLSGLDGRLEMRSGVHAVWAAAAETSEPGHYRAMFTPPFAGNWTIDILSGFTGGLNSSRITVRAVASPDQAPVVSETERGRRLFAGKGCITCHVHRGVEASRVSTGAPDLTAKRYQPEYLKRVLVNPPQPQPRQPYAGWAMPDLKLRDTEIASLVAFLNN
jgi:hypothetical protein